jgi:two-component system chemotaxis response regulator CheB
MRSSRVSLMPGERAAAAPEPREPGARRAFALVAIAASAGGLAALKTVLATLPRDFPLPIVIVQHIDPNRDSLLARILSRCTELHVKQAEPEDLLKPGLVLVAPPGNHMLVGEGGRIRLSHTEPVHFVRPSADSLFESAAVACGPIIGVILTGTGSDGASGSVAIKAAGGLVIAQDEKSSAFFGMPQAAINSGAVDLVLPLSDIASTLARLARS